MSQTWVVPLCPVMSVLVTVFLWSQLSRQCAQHAAHVQQVRRQGNDGLHRLAHATPRLPLRQPMRNATTTISLVEGARLCLSLRYALLSSYMLLPRLPSPPPPPDPKPSCRMPVPPHGRVCASPPAPALTCHPIHDAPSAPNPACPGPLWPLCSTPSPAFHKPLPSARAHLVECAHRPAPAACTGPSSMLSHAQQAALSQTPPPPPCHRPSVPGGVCASLPVPAPGSSLWQQAHPQAPVTQQQHTQQDTVVLAHMQQPDLRSLFILATCRDSCMGTAATLCLPDSAYSVDVLVKRLNRQSICVQRTEGRDKESTSRACGLLLRQQP